MDEDEIDPAFMNDDLDSPGGGLGSLDGMLGGESLGGQLSNHDHDPFFASTSSSSSRLAEDDSLAGMGTPLRRSRGAGGAAPSSHRLSLAFELAAATPGRGGNRDLMRELGIEEDDGEEEEYNSEEEGEREEGEEESVERLHSTTRGGADELGDEAHDHDHDYSTAASTPLRRLKGYSSSASLSSSFQPDSSETSFGTSSPGNTREDHDASFLEASTALESSLETTGLFLLHLRQHTNGEADPNAPTPAAKSLSLASSAADPFSLSPSNRIPTDYSDRQPLLESKASSYLKLMSDVGQQREEQVKELGEMERLVTKNEVAWKATLALLDPLPEDEDAESISAREREGEDEDPVTPIQSAHRTYSEGVLGQSPSNIDATPRRRVTSNNLKSTSLPSSARVELSNLRDITSSLISALSAINEVTQVNQAATGEAGRKLRALRNHLVTVKDDLSSYERSEEYVRDYEAKGARKKGAFAELAKEEMRGAEKALEEGWNTAQQVLAAA